MTICVHTVDGLITALSGNRPRQEFDLVSQQVYDLGGSSIRARPALVRDGLVYATRQGRIFYRPFREGTPLEIARTPVDDSFETPLRSSPPVLLDGIVTVADDRILVSSSFGVRCFKELPKPIIEKGRKPR